MTRECEKMFQCLYGDGGTLCDSRTRVAAMGADAMGKWTYFFSIMSGSARETKCENHYDIEKDFFQCYL